MESNFWGEHLLSGLREHNVSRTIYSREEENHTQFLSFSLTDIPGVPAHGFVETNQYFCVLLSNFSLYRKWWGFMADLMRMQQLKLGCGGRKRNILELPAGMAMFVTWLCRAHPRERGESLGCDSFSLRLSWWG